MVAKKIIFRIFKLKKGFLMAVLNEIRIEGKGQNYENQNIKIQKDHQKCFKASEHRKCPSEFPHK